METRFGTASVLRYPAIICLSERGEGKGSALRDPKRTVEVRELADDGTNQVNVDVPQKSAQPPRMESFATFSFFPAHVLKKILDTMREGINNNSSSNNNNNNKTISRSSSNSSRSSNWWYPSRSPPSEAAMAIMV